MTMNIEFEKKLAEQQRHMDWYAQECSTSEPEQFAYYQKEYYSLMRQRTEAQRSSLLRKRSFTSGVFEYLFIIHISILVVFIQCSL